MRTYLTRSILALMFGLSFSSVVAAQNLSGYFKLQTKYQEADNKCLVTNNFSPKSPFSGAAFMDLCQVIASQYWMFEPAQDGYYTLKTLFQQDQNKCLKANHFASNAILGRSAYMENCQNAPGQLWKITPKANGYFTLQTMLHESDNRCFEGNRYAPELMTGGAAFMDRCQNVTGQQWKLANVQSSQDADRVEKVFLALLSSVRMLHSNNIQAAKDVLTPMSAEVKLLSQTSRTQFKRLSLMSELCVAKNTQLLIDISNQDKILRQQESAITYLQASVIEEDVKLQILKDELDVALENFKSAETVYQRKRKKIKEAADKPWEFWRSFDVLFSGDLTNINNLRDNVHDVSAKYSDKIASLNASKEERYKLHQKIAQVQQDVQQLQSSLDAVEDTQHNVLMSALVLESSAQVWVRLEPALSITAMAAINNLSALADVIGTALDSDALVKEIRLGEIQTLEKTLSGIASSLQRALAIADTAKGC